MSKKPGNLIERNPGNGHPRCCGMSKCVGADVAEASPAHRGPESRFDATHRLAAMLHHIWAGGDLASGFEERLQLGVRIRECSECPARANGW